MAAFIKKVALENTNCKNIQVECHLFAKKSGINSEELFVTLLINNMTLLKISIK